MFDITLRRSNRHREGRRPCYGGRAKLLHFQKSLAEMDAPVIVLPGDLIPAPSVVAGEAVKLRVGPGVRQEFSNDALQVQVYSSSF